MVAVRRVLLAVAVVAVLSASLAAAAATDENQRQLSQSAEAYADGSKPQRPPAATRPRKPPGGARKPPGAARKPPASRRNAQSQRARALARTTPPASQPPATQTPAASQTAGQTQPKTATTPTPTPKRCPIDYPNHRACSALPSDYKRGGPGVSCVACNNNDAGFTKKDIKTAGDSTACPGPNAAAHVSCHKPHRSSSGNRGRSETRAGQLGLSTFTCMCCQEPPADMRTPRANLVPYFKCA